MAVKRRQGIIREQVITTFHAVLSDYIHSYNKTASIMPAGMYTEQDPPSLLTNCVKLAESCKATDRTVRNHITILRNLGVVRTQFHGSKKSFELWISSEILFGKGGLENAENTPKTAILQKESKNFPHIHTYGEVIETENKKADLCIVDTERTHTERAVGQDTAISSEKGTSAYLSQPIGTEGEIMGPRRVPRLPEKLQTLHARILMQFWLYAWKVLYPNREFSIDQQEKALVAIWEGVYGRFEEMGNDEQWMSFHSYQIEKLDKAAKYYDYHPEQYPGDPYAVLVKGKGYFDRENIHGFKSLDAWMKRDAIRKATNKAAYREKKKKLEERLYGLLRQARRDFEKLHAGKPMRKEVKSMTQIGLFQYWHAVFKQFGQTWADKFCHQWQTQHANDFRPPVYYSTPRQRRRAGESLGEVVIVQPWMEGDGTGYYSEI